MSDRPSLRQLAFASRTGRLHRALWNAISLMLLIFLIPAAHAQNFTVNSTADRVDQTPGDGKCSTGETAPDGSGNPECTLRAAVQESNADPGAHQITLPGGTYELILPTPCLYPVYSGPDTDPGVVTAICFTGQITIQGAGAAQTIIDAGQTDRAAWVSAGATVRLQGVTLQNGSAYYSGGCLINAGNVSLIESNVTSCVVLDGGAIYNFGNLNIVSSTITGNDARYSGGGIYNSGTLSVSYSIVSSNIATGYSGGGIANQGVTSITESTISGNNAGIDGGGIYNLLGPLVTIALTNTTISGNGAGSRGGGIENFGTQTMNNVTITQNTASGAGGYEVFNNGSVGGSISMGNTIIAGNTSGGVESDCSTAGQLPGRGSPNNVSLGYNLIQDPTGCLLTGNTSTNITGVNPWLGNLTNNGGPTPTVALLPGSPAIDAGSSSTPGSGGSACAITDQRGLFRPQGARCDIGAFEATRGLFLSAISPAQGGSGGSVTAVISGSGMLSGATVQLRLAGQQSISASPTAEDPGQASMSGTFDLSGAAQGRWDVVVTNPDGTLAALPGAFTVAAPQSPRLFVSLVGRSAIRANGQPGPYSILIANRGNTDALGVPIIVGVPTGFAFNLLFPLLPPPSNASQIYSNWPGVPMLLATPQPTFINLPILVPVVPAGYSGMLTFTLAVPPGDAQGGTDFLFNMYLNSDNPYFNPALDPNVVSQFVSNAQNYSQSNWGVTIPNSLVPGLQAYVTSELQTAIANGRTDLVASLGGRTDAFSLTQFLIDAASVGASEALGASAPAAMPAVKSASHKLFAMADSLPAPQKIGNQCSGQIMAPGSSCGDAPIELPPGVPLPPGCNPAKNELTNCGKLTPPACGLLPNHHVSSDGQTCLPNNSGPCPVNSEGAYYCRPFPILIVSALDPNDKAGPMGAGSANYLPGGQQPMAYSIFFENQASATAPAQQVVVTDQLDMANLDPSTFTLGPIAFGNYQILPTSGQSQYSAGIDLRPAQDVEVKINASLNKATGVATWTFTSIDPETGQLTTNPLAGFLPPDKTPPQGLGTIFFTVYSKATSATNATTCNQATVVFDTNAPINTPSWCNSFDSTAPVSHVKALPATEANTNFTVQWSGTDLGAGIASYSIFVSDNGGVFTAFQTNTPSTSAVFTGLIGHTYGFYSIATDLVGNVEGPKTVAEALSTVGSVASVSVPKVVGLTQAAASAAIMGVGLKVGTITSQSSSTVPSGSVISQSPLAGTSVSSGSSVNLTVSTGLASVTVPSVVGLTQTTASTAITAAGLTLGAVSSASSASVSSGAVISQSPAAGTSVTLGSALNLVVSSGPATVSIVLGGAPVITSSAAGWSVTVLLQNTGNVTAQTVQEASATLGGVAALAVIPSITLVPGATGSVVLSFPASAGAAGAAVALSMSGSYSAASLSGNWTVGARSRLP